MWQALLWGGIAGSSVVIGALIGLYLHIKKSIAGYIMAFGTGVLIGAAAFELLTEAIEMSMLTIIGIAFLLGAILFTSFDLMIAKKGAKDRKRSKQNPDGHSGLAIFIGTLIDAIPESTIIGVSLLDHSMSMLLIVAIFISNVPEGLSSSIGLKKDGYSNSKILFLWIVVCILASLSSLIGYHLLEGVSEHWIAGINSFAAGGIVAMVSSTMMPEAHEEGGPIVGLITALGLICSLILANI